MYQKLQGVIDINDIYISEITHRIYVLNAYILISKEVLDDFEELAKEINIALLERFEIEHTTFQPEWIKNISS